VKSIISHSLVQHIYNITQLTHTTSAHKLIPSLHLSHYIHSTQTLK
jgi:hypothetical protein